MKTLPRQIKHHPIGRIPVHITLRLFGSIPKVVGKDLQRQRENMFLEAEREIAALPDEVTAELSRDILARIDE